MPVDTLYYMPVDTLYYMPGENKFICQKKVNMIYLKLSIFPKQAKSMDRACLKKDHST